MTADHGESYAIYYGASRIIKYLKDTFLPTSASSPCIKTIPVAAVISHRVEMSGIQHFLDNRLTDGGKLSDLGTGRALLHRKIILLLLVLISVRG
jgi:hypothetical protein